MLDARVFYILDPFDEKKTRVGIRLQFHLVQKHQKDQAPAEKDQIRIYIEKVEDHGFEKESGVLFSKAFPFPDQYFNLLVPILFFFRLRMNSSFQQSPTHFSL